MTAVCLATAEAAGGACGCFAVAWTTKLRERDAAGDPARLNMLVPTAVGGVITSNRLTAGGRGETETTLVTGAATGVGEATPIEASLRVGARMRIPFNGANCN